MVKIQLECTHCKKEFGREKSEYNRQLAKGNTNIYCSRACGAEHKKSLIIYFDYSCLNCCNTFQKTEREVKSMAKKGHEIKFCSKECKSDYWGRNRIEVSCPICDKVTLRQEKDVYNHNFCSNECYDIHRNSLREDISCLCCDKIFSVLTSDLKNVGKVGYTKIHTCSNECYLNVLSEKYIDVKCKYCEEAFTKLKSDTNKVYCTSKCRGEYWDKYNRINKTCPQCKEPFVAKMSQSNKVFCSNKCWNTYRETTKKGYKAVSGYLRSTINYEKWRLAVIDRAEHKCEECGSMEEHLHAHHIIHLYKIAKSMNFDKQLIKYSDIFNDIDNGKCLCSSCHLKKHPNLSRNTNGTFCRSDAEPY